VQDNYRVMLKYFEIAVEWLDEHILQQILFLIFVLL
jgi:hypothetical protein